MTLSLKSPSPPFLRTLAVLIAIAHALLALTSKTETCVTADEIAYVVAGHAYNIRADFRLQPENGNLPQRWAALPLTLQDTKLPPTDRPAWRRGDVWAYGHETFYRWGLSTDAMLFATRGMIALFSAATALLVFAWSRALFGWRGAFLSLALYAFCPAFLAHGALATSDVVITFFFLASIGAWWAALQQPTLGRACLSAFTFGLACVSKFSAVLLLPMFAICSIVWLSDRFKTDGQARSLRWLATTSAIHVAGAWLVIWTFYGFRFSAFASTPSENPQFYRGDWAWILSDMGWPRIIFESLRDLHVLPEAFLYGFAFVLQFSRERAAFFSGEYSTTGWLWFFPFAFLVKSTLPFLLLLFTALAGVISRWRSKPIRPPLSLFSLTPLIALFGVYWTTSLTSHLNIGHRHILPIYPVLFIAAGWFGQELDRRRPIITTWVLIGLVWHVAESLRIRPHYLAYFNQIVGGPQNGWRHLVDSSLDWGQDLPGLKRWLDRNARGEKIFLSYFGTGDPAYEGIETTMLPTLPEVGPPRPWHALSPGVYAVGATMLQHVYARVRGPWTVELEKEFQQLRALEPTLLSYQHDPRQRVALLNSAPAENWKTAWQRYEQLRFARLCHYLRARAPDGVIGYSIFVYRLNNAELAGAVGGSIEEWTRLIERAVEQRHANRPSE